MRKMYFFIMTCAAAILNAQVGTTCDNPIVIGSLPYSTTDNTANYADNYDFANNTNPPHICTSGTNYEYGRYYHNGNDVIYSYTPASSGTIKIEIPNAVGWTGMFVYTDCANIGVTGAACRTSPSAGARTVDNFAVTAGQTYYILISSWAAPQTVAYTLNVTQLSLGTDEVEKARKAVSVYPNPADKDLYFKSDKKITSASIYTMEGRKINVHNKVDDNKISIQELPAGNYIVEFSDKEGSVYTKVFIKK